MKVYLCNEERTELTLVPLAGIEEIALMQLLKVFINGGALTIEVNGEGIKRYPIAPHEHTSENSAKIINGYLGAKDGQ